MKADNVEVAPMASFPIPEGVEPTKKPDGSSCFVVEGSVSEGDGRDAGRYFKVSKITPYADYAPKKGKPEPDDEAPEGEKPEPPAKKPGKKMPARLAAVMGDKDEDMGY